jgi:oxygen-independent coproporphyrinogen-3 oxidase
VNGVRWRNVSGTADYIDRLSSGTSPAIDERALSPQERLEEHLFTGLRLSAGINRFAVQEMHRIDPWVAYGEALTPFVDAGLMWTTQDHFGLTRRGMLVANDILVTFV